MGEPTDVAAAYWTYIDSLTLAAHGERSWWHQTFGSGKFGPSNCVSCTRIALAVTVALTAPDAPGRPQ